MEKKSLKEIKIQAELMAADEALQWLLTLSPLYGTSLNKLIEQTINKVQKKDLEYKRLDEMMVMERDLKREGYLYIGGIDEAGRGPLAGPVVAACVILPEDVYFDKLNDSKKLSATVRDRLFDEIQSKAIAWGIGICDEKYIDEVNILNATKKAMEIAVEAMGTKPDALIIDAVSLKLPIRQVSIPKADEKSAAVAAASVLAKVTRDRIMENYHDTYPVYGFSQHKGYGTSDHILAIREYGLCDIHRRSFTHSFV
jgi:ribonuclease HII